MQDPTVIREAHLSDAPYLNEICLKTGFSGTSAENMFYDVNMIGHYYASNYLYFERDCCFVVEEADTNSEKPKTIEQRVPQGYILGCTNSDSFNEWMENEWLPPLRKRYALPYEGKTDFENRIIKLFHNVHERSKKDWAKDFPAHLHIDILPSLQGKGCGKALMHVFLNRLKEKKVSGVHLGVGSSNEKAIAFYTAMGFFVLEHIDSGLILGKAL